MMGRDPALLVWPAIAASVFFAVGYWVLANGHPAEDAYILFVYVENIVAGHGVVFYPGGPRAEGATDFLWLVALAALTRAGLDVAVAALVLNALGAALLSVLMLKVVEATADRRTQHAIGATSAAILPASPLAAASYGGFSTMLFAALIACVFYCHWRWRFARLVYLPAVALILALFRPDGALVGAVATFVSLVQLWGTVYFRRLLAAVLICGAIGLAYFLWRYSYFGMLLPLPLEVKSSNDSILPGFEGGVAWFARVLWYLPLLGLLLLYESGSRRLLAALAAPVSLTVALLFVSSIQNIALRYQNAIFGVILLIFACAIVQLTRALEMRARVKHAGLVVVLLFGFAATSDAGFRYVRRELAHMTSHDYSSYIAFHVGERVPGEIVVALTEAGKFSYWSRGEMHDLVGLNSPEIVRDGLTDEYLEKLSPDVMFVHSANILTDLEGCASNYKVSSAAELDKTLKPEFRDWRAWRHPSIRAAGAVTTHLISNPAEFSVFQVCYAGRFDHVFAVRVEGRVPPAAFEDALRLSLSREGRRSYFELKRSRAVGSR